MRRTSTSCVTTIRPYIVWNIFVTVTPSRSFERIMMSQSTDGSYSIAQSIGRFSLLIARQARVRFRLAGQADFHTRARGLAGRRFLADHRPRTAHDGDELSAPEDADRLP